MRTLRFLSVLVAIIGCLETQGQVISQPDDVTICEGEGAVFTCVLNGSIRSDDVQWYRFIKDTSTTVMVDPNGGNINFLTHTNESATSSSLNITNAIKLYTGYFWVESLSLNICNASLTVTKRPSALTVDIIKNIESSSIIVQWDAVDDFLHTTYIIIWTDGRDLHGVATVGEQTSYTITGLTLDTVYTITVTAANRCGQGPEFRTSVSLSTDITSTTSTITPTVTTSTNIMTTTIINPSTTTTTADTGFTTTSAPVITLSTTTTNLMTTTVSTHTKATVTTTNIIRQMTTTTSVINLSTTTAPAAATVSSSSFTGTTTASSITTITTTTASINVAMSSTPATNFTNKADVSSGGSDSSAGYIVAAVIGGIIVVSAIFIMIYCFVLYRKKHGKADVDDDIKLNQYTNFPRDNKKVPSVSNAMIIYDDEPFKLRSGTSQQDMSVTVTPYTVVDIGDLKNSNSTFQPSHLPNDKMEPPNPSTANGSLAPQKGETDTQQQQHSVEYAVVDRRKKKSRKEGKQQNDDAHEVTDNGVQHISVPTVSGPGDDDHASDEAVKSKKHPSLHYAELEMLPPSTDRYTISDEPPIVYAQVV